MGELPTNERAAATGEEKTTCKTSWSSDIPSNVDLKGPNGDFVVTRSLSYPSSEIMIGDDSSGHCPCTRTGADITVLRNTEANCSQDNFVLDTSPVVGNISAKSSAFDSTDRLETKKLVGEIAVLSSNNEVLSSYDDASKVDDQHDSHQAQTSSGGSQLTSSDSSDAKRCAGKIIQETGTLALVDHSFPASGAYLIDCTVVPGPDLPVIESDFDQNSSPITGNCEKVMEDVHLMSKGLELFGDLDLKVMKSPSSNVAQLLSDKHTPFAPDFKTITKSFQLGKVAA